MRQLSSKHGGIDLAKSKTPWDISIQNLLENFELIESDLTSQAQELVQECRKLLDKDFKDRKVRRPPISLACRLRKDRYGPTLVWVRYTIAKRNLKNGTKSRFTTEVRGRRNHTYPCAIFKGFRDDVLIEQLIDIEKRAADIRRATSHWTTIKSSVAALQEIKERLG